jgi:hypothetical protein
LLSATPLRSCLRASTLHSSACRDTWIPCHHC